MKKSVSFTIIAIAVAAWCNLPNVLSQDGGAPSSIPRHVRFADPAMNGIRDIQGVTFLKGGDYPIRASGAVDFSDQSTRVSYEVFRDDDFGTLLYVTEDGAAAAVPCKKNFELRTLAENGFYEAVRFSPASGIAWRLEGSEWKLIAENKGAHPKPGDYDIQLHFPEEGSLHVMRIEQRSGHSWAMNDGHWVPIAEASPSSEP